MILRRIQQANERYNVLVNNLLDELSCYDDAILNRKPQNGGWSALQIAHHLLLSEEISMTYVQKKLSFAKEGKAEFKPIGFKSKWRYFRLWLVFSLPFRFKAPATLDTEKMPDYTSLAHTRERWMNIRTQWNNFLNHLPESLADKAVFRHQLVGKMSWVDMCDFYSLHLRRHWKQIRRTV